MFVYVILFKLCMFHLFVFDFNENAKYTALYVSFNYFIIFFLSIRPHHRIFHSQNMILLEANREYLLPVYCTSHITLKQFMCKLPYTIQQFSE